jgi:hypothetical protein
MVNSSIGVALTPSPAIDEIGLEKPVRRAVNTDRATR